MSMKKDYPVILAYVVAFLWATVLFAPNSIALIGKTSYSAGSSSEIVDKCTSTTISIGTMLTDTITGDIYTKNSTTQCVWNHAVSGSTYTLPVAGNGVLGGIQSGASTTCPINKVMNGWDSTTGIMNCVSDQTGSGSTEMDAAIYDPRGIVSDVFLRSNHTGSIPFSVMSGTASASQIPDLSSLYSITTHGHNGTYVPVTRTINGDPLSSDITLSTNDISDSTDRRYVTDAQLASLGSISGNVVVSVKSGTSISIDNTDPANPIVSYSPGVFTLVPSDPDVLGYDKDHPYIIGTNNEDVLSVPFVGGISPVFLLFPVDFAKDEILIIADESILINTSTVDWSSLTYTLENWDNLQGIQLRGGSLLRVNKISPGRFGNSLGVQGQLATIELRGGVDFREGYETRNTLSDAEYSDLGTFEKYVPVDTQPFLPIDLTGKTIYVNDTGYTIDLSQVDPVLNNSFRHLEIGNNAVSIFLGIRFLLRTDVIYEEYSGGGAGIDFPPLGVGYFKNVDSDEYWLKLPARYDYLELRMSPLYPEWILSHYDFLSFMQGQLPWARVDKTGATTQDLSILLTPVSVEGASDPTYGQIKYFNDGVTKCFLLFFPGDDDPVRLGERNI